MFVDGHEWPDMVKDCKQFLTKIKKMELYFIEFREDKTIKERDYLLDCAVEGENCQPIIVITHKKCTFSANNGIWKAWTQVGKTFLWPKNRK